MKDKVVNEVQQLLEKLEVSPDSRVYSTLNRWLTRSQEFREFVDDDRNRNKVRSKLNPKNDISANLFELYIGYLLLSSTRYSILYYEKEAEGPDYEVEDIIKNIAFNVEVTTRVYSDLEIRFANWKSELAKRIRKIQSTFAVWVDIDEMDNPEQTMKILEDQLEATVTELKMQIERSSDHLEVNQSRTYKPAILPGIEIEIRYPPGKDHNLTDFYGGSYPPLIKRVEEDRSFWDKVNQKLRQMKQNEINILVILTGSNRYDFVHVPAIMRYFDDEALALDGLILVTSWKPIPLNPSIHQWIKSKTTWLNRYSQLSPDTFDALADILLFTTDN